MILSLALSATISAASTVPPDALGLSIDDAKVRLRESADRAFENGRDLVIASASSETDRPALLQAAARAVELARARFREAVESQIVFVRAAHRAGVPSHELFTRATTITDHYASLPVPKGPYSSSSQAFAVESLIWRRGRDMKRDWNLSPLVHRLREHPDALARPEVQRALERVVVGRLGDVVDRTVWINAHRLGWTWAEPGADPTSPLERYDFVGEPWPAGPRNYNRLLLGAVLYELVTNARQATRVRHCADRLEWRARTTMRRLEDDRFVMEIEDFGEPSHYEAVTGLGQSFDPRSGGGLGRFKSHLIADFLEYELTRTVKPDGSGSILRMTIPRRHGL